MARKVYVGIPNGTALNEFTQPILIENGTLGGNSFAVSASNITTGYEAWRAFSSDTSIAYSSSVNPSSQTIYYTIYNPAAIKLTNITFTNVPSGLTSSSPSAGSIQGSNNNSSWTTITSFTNSNNTNSSTWSVNLTPSAYYKYYRIAITGANTTQAYVNIGKIKLTAEYQWSDTLPSGYTRLDYIQSSGTQYINTGFASKNTTRVVMDFEFPTTPTATYSAPWALFGSRTSAQSNNYAFLVLSDSSNSSNKFFRSDYNGTYTQQWSITLTGRKTVDKNQNITTLNGTTQTYTSASFTSPGNLMLFALNNNGTVQWHASMRLYSCQIFDNGTLVRYYIPCKNSSGTLGLYDVANNQFYTNAGSGTFTAGPTFTIKSVARNVKKMYVGVSGKAHRIKKGYIGIGGVARPFWGGLLEYWGTATELSVGRANLAATTVGNYALFGGGYGYNGSENTSLTTVDAYNKSLTKSLPTSFSEGADNVKATTVGNYALFVGGKQDEGFNTTTCKVEAYNTSLTRSNPTALSDTRYGFAATTVGNYALFGGGGKYIYNNSSVNNIYSSTVDTYNKSLTRSSASSLTNKCRYPAATTVGSYALFAGGEYKQNSVYGHNYYTTVNVYNSSLSKSTGTALSAGRERLAAVTVGDYALFAGGTGADSYYATVDVYNSSLTKSTATALSRGRYYMTSTTVGNYALIAGGWYNGESKIVDVYNSSLTKSVAANTSSTHYQAAATTIGNYALIGGGDYGISTVDVYTA